MNDMLVKELREEHRDREWVDKRGLRWIWCDGEWAVSVPNYYRQDRVYNFIPASEWPTTVYENWPSDTLGDPDINGHRHYLTDMRDPWVSQGPFMEAMHYKLLWEQR